MLIDVEDVALGHETKMRWNDRDEWVWSDQQTHEALVSVEQFEAAQLVLHGSQHAKTVYVKEASILPAIDGWLAATCAALESALGPDPAEESNGSDHTGRSITRRRRWGR